MNRSLKIFASVSALLVGYAIASPADAAPKPKVTMAAVTNTVNGVPTTKKQCKNDGWKNYVKGTPATRRFKNQGDCVSFVATHGNNTAG